VDNRPGFLALLDELAKGDVVLVAKRDRLARGDDFLTAWIDKEIQVRRASVWSAAGEGNGDDPASILMRRMVDAFAEYEVKMIAARTRAALAAKRKRGERVSRFAPYGFRHEADRLVPDEHEQAGAKLASELRARGATLREVSARMAEKGFTARSGRPLSPQAVSNILEAGEAN
jgi:DNA invertase Pin-like site-specific DNA recombinase